MAGIYTRALRRIGHGRWFAVAVKRGGCRLVKALFRASGGRWTLTGRVAPTMLLTTRGRRTGKDRTVPVFYVRDGERLVASCENFGLRTASGWPVNLRAHPYATITHDGTTRAYTSAELTGEERDRCFRPGRADEPGLAPLP